MVRHSTSSHPPCRIRQSRTSGAGPRGGLCVARCDLSPTWTSRGSTPPSEGPCEGGTPTAAEHSGFTKPAARTRPCALLVCECASSSNPSSACVRVRARVCVCVCVCTLRSDPEPASGRRRSMDAPMGLPPNSTPRVLARTTTTTTRVRVHLVGQSALDWRVIKVYPPPTPPTHPPDPPKSNAFVCSQPTRH
jgi:hypothetical protein